MSAETIVTPELARHAPKPIQLAVTIDDGDEEGMPAAISALLTAFVREKLVRESRKCLSATATADRLGTATTNMGFKAKVRLQVEDEAEEREELYFLRIFGAGTEFLYDRQRELRVMEAASAWGLGPRLYAEFENGIIAQFLLGRELVTHEVRCPDMSGRIAREAARWHRIPPPRVFKSDTDRQLATGNSFATLEKWVRRADQLFNPGEDRNLLRYSTRSVRILGAWAAEWPRCKKEIDIVVRTIRAHWQRVYETEEAVPLVFSHNDLTPGNIFLLDRADDAAPDAKQEFLFVDVETASLNYAGFDLGNFCNEWCGVMTIDWHNFPSDDQQRAFVSEYLHERFGSEPSAELLENFLAEVKYFSLFSNLFWCVWGIIQACQSHITTFSHLDYSRIRWDRFLDVRSQFTLLEDVEDTIEKQ